MGKYKFLKVILSMTMIISLCLYPTKTYANDDPVNLALHKVSQSSAAESNGSTTLSADKAFDGITNRGEKDYSKTSRWGTPKLNGSEQPWISVDLGEKKTFQSFVIQWETANITGYKIETQDDLGAWNTIYTKPGTQDIAATQEIIHLTQPVSAQKVRLTITGYEDAVPGWKSVSIYEFQIYENNVPDAVLSNQNIALKKTATASDVESNGSTTLSADKAFDGIVNRDEKDYSKLSRWGTNQLDGLQQPWLMADLGSKQYMRSFRIDWERTNITGFKIQISDDKTSWKDVYTKQGIGEIANVKTPIQLDQAVYGQYVRLLVTGYTGGTINWKSVSVYEFSIYQTTLEALEPTKPTLKDVAASIQAPVVEKKAKKLVMPSVPKGFTIALYGVDYKQIIDTDGTIYQPLVTSKVQVKFKVSDATGSTTTNEISVVVPGSVDHPITENKPAVIPELREWSGQEGNFAITGLTKIVVNPTYTDALSQAMKEFQDDYKDITGKAIEIVTGTMPGKNDFYFTLGSHDLGLKEEGYRIQTTKNGVSVEALDTKGAYWSTRTILQILKQNKTTIPCGMTRDYPKYKLRGFMLDVGRMPFRLDFIKDIAKNMSWYKLNDFQIHLTDNYIWIEEYQNPIKDAYSGFRLESSIVGSNGIKLTSSDMSYTKKEFSDFIKESRNIGVNIVPEIDTPAHSLALTKVRPDLAMKDTSVARHSDHLDLNTKYNESLSFVKDVFNEYLEGDHPTFDKDTIVNVGTDEYDGKYSEQFRKYTDDMLAFIQKGNRTVRLWGSLSTRNGTTPVRSKGVQMNIWNNGWANPNTMLQQGYNLINMNDGQLYIVPSGDGSRGGYADRLKVENLYDNWTPNNFGGVIISPTESQMLGASYAMWNDNAGKRSKGLADVDYFKRFFEPLPTVAEKMWGEAKDKNFQQLNEVTAKTGTAPNTNPYYEVASKTDMILDYNFDKDPISDASGNRYDVKNKVHADLVTDNKSTALALKGAQSYVETPIVNIGPNSTLKFSMKKNTTPSKEKQIIFESNRGTIEIEKDTGKLGFSRLANTFSFNYVVPDNTWVNIELRALSQQTDLYINGKFVDSISLHSTTTQKVGTLILPMQRIGSMTQAFSGLIDNVIVLKGATAYVDPTIIPTKNFVVTTSNEEADHGSEGPIKYAFDGDSATLWHSQYTPINPVNKSNPAIVNIDMKNVKNVNKFSYLPRQDSTTNGIIKSYELYGKEHATDSFVLLSSGTLADDHTLKEITFPKQNIRYLQLKVLQGDNDFASAAEFNVHQFIKETNILQNRIDEVKAMDTSAFTTSSVKALQKEIKKAQDIANKENVGEEEQRGELKQLNAAVDALLKQADTKAAKAVLKEITNKKLQESAYSIDSWKLFITAKATLEKVIQDVSDINETQLAKIVSNLQNAYNNLEKSTIPIVDRRKLQELYEENRNKTNTNYTDASWATFTKALVRAKEILASTQSMQKDIDDATLALQTAVQRLVVKPDSKPEIITDLSDKTSGIEIQGAFEKGSIFTAQVLNNTTIANMIKDKAYVSTIKIEKGFNFTLEKNGNKIFPLSDMEIRIPISNALRKKKLDVIYIEVQGNVKILSSYIKDNNIIFKTNHFSTYAIVSYENTQPISTSTTTKKHKTSVDTGDTTNYVVIELIFLVSGVGLCMLIYFKRRKSDKKMD